MITLVAVLCHFNIVPLCVEEIITESNFTSLAGKVDDPVDMGGLPMVTCKMEAPIIIASWMAQHPIYHDGSYYVQEIKCVQGQYTPKRAI